MVTEEVEGRLIKLSEKDLVMNEIVSLQKQTADRKKEIEEYIREKELERKKESLEHYFKQARELFISDFFSLSNNWLNLDRKSLINRDKKIILQILDILTKRAKKRAIAAKILCATFLSAGPLVSFLLRNIIFESLENGIMGMLAMSALGCLFGGSLIAAPSWSFLRKLKKVKSLSKNKEDYFPWDELKEGLPE